MPATPADPPPSPDEIITVQTTDEVLTVCVHGVLDATNAPALAHCLDAVQAAGVLGPRRLVLDLRALTGCDGAGLGAVLAALTRVERAGIALHIDGLDGVAGRMLAASHLRTDFAAPAGRSGRAPRHALRTAAQAERHRPSPR
ncbi:STAS domain-containing protein [Planobispora siamensis]|uniref:STAS domain-containing protein n=1 Tax=Planobispora siamensis TaxID=936338 RepID=A0A8J3SDY1_9ACTN|nr:STAS domain-containing protein [Planobispora siamensis]GIH92876.1 hypothetical protein Psi01_35060 [Planobispora siamensis]